MGALRIKESVDELLERDPYELFSLDQPHSVGRRLRPPVWRAAGVGVLAAFGVACAAFWQMQRTASAAEEQPFAYFEIKAIDPDGRLVAGAVVKDRGTTLGVTDTFGEWRRFMRVKPGATVLLQLTKQTEGGGLSAVKNIAVPMVMPKSGDLELTGSVQLQRPGLTAERRPGAAAKAAPVAGRSSLGAEPVAEGFAARTPLGVASTTSVDAASAAVQVPARAAAGSRSEAAATPVVPAAAADFGTVWFMTEGRPSVGLGDVVTALRRRSRELGVRVEPASGWRISLAELALPGEDARLVRVDGLLEAGGHLVRSFSFLRNYGESPTLTARDILWALTSQVPKRYQVAKRDGVWYLAGEVPRLWTLTPGRTVFGDAGQRFRVAADGPDLLRLADGPGDPCPAAECTVAAASAEQLPPVPGWERLPLTVYGAGPDVVVYVSGYAAHKSGEKAFAYWGTPGSAVNVTAVRGGRLVYRGRVQTAGGSVPSVTLPSAALSGPNPLIDKTPPVARQW